MAATLAVVALMLVLLALPRFFDDHRPELWFPLILAALVLAGVMVAALPLALAHGSSRVRAGYWVPIAAYVGLLLIEPFTLRERLPEGSTPWLLGLSLIAFSCTVLVVTDPVRSAAICTGIDVALACVYADRFPLSHTLITSIGLLLLAVGLIAGVRALRARADQADAAELQAQLLFERQQHQVATEAERVRTDALLHDTVLAAFLAAAGNHVPERATNMARAALDLFSSSNGRPHGRPALVPFGVVWSEAGTERAPFDDLVSFDLTQLDVAELPSDVAEAVVSATLQALTNSVAHAGSSAVRSAAGSLLDDGGIRITVSDDGVGFDSGRIPQERLGVRVSILERLRQVGGSATIRSSPGMGTTVTLEWHPDRAEAPLTRQPGELLIHAIPRRVLYRLFGALIVIAVLIATADAVLVTHAYASVASSILGLLILPTLIRGAKQGKMSDRAAWGTAGVGVLLCSIATIGLDASDFDSASIARYTCGVLAGATMGWMAGRRLPPLVTVTALVTQMTLWAGPTGVIRLGLAGEIVIVIAGLLIHRAIRRVAAAADLAARKHRDLTIRQAELDAFDGERHHRLRHAGSTSAPMLRRIIDTRGELDGADRAECRVLEQALRDEIRGRTLLNDAIRRVVFEHRRRGTLVQILDDGGLHEMAPTTLDALLDDVARHLEPLRSSRIVIRTGQPDSDTAITIVASTPDETAAALGLDSDDEVDLWLTIPHPDTVELAA
ncbi:sensor histidine kinase [Frondihabitans sp. Leaf304]|uniref:sensor histidine kinase n=1 Tax=Frondihabitans sp. Leaf304 TaxID=1736329 RepID=UPI0006F96C79|nr:ATP-binding protein [Frondihabitans sp. Leaf304]KQQ28483.1 hypothetical protein ASF54_07365 [Frondihabitans sp. Leaf304]